MRKRLSAPDAERGVLASIVTNPHVMTEAAEKLSVHSFSSSYDHQAIFSAMLDLHHRGLVVDPPTLDTVLRDRNQERLLILVLEMAASDSIVSLHASSYIKLVQEAEEANQVAQFRLISEKETTWAGIEQVLSQARERAGQGKPRGSGKPRLHVAPSMLEIEEVDVQWLWEPYIPLGKLTLMEGDPGSGKSWAALAIAAGISRGRAFPGSPRELYRPGRVLLLMGEDDYGDTIKPRLRWLGADMSLIRPVLGLYVTEGAEEDIMMLSPEGIAALADEVQTYQPRLVIVDPIVAFLSADVDTNKANEVRSVLRPVGKIAADSNAAVIGIRHLTKAMHSMATYRGQGSIDFFAISRSVLLIAKDPNDPTRRVMKPSKASLAEEGVGQCFRITRVHNGAEFYWEGSLDVSTQELLTSGDERPEEKTAVEEAKEFLTEVLFDGPVESEIVLKEARHAGHAERTIQRAKAILQVRSFRRAKEGGRRGEGSWYWELPLVEDGDVKRGSLKDGGLKEGPENGVQTPNEPRSDEPETFKAVNEMDDNLKRKTDDEELF